MAAGVAAAEWRRTLNSNTRKWSREKASESESESSELTSSATEGRKRWVVGEKEIGTGPLASGAITSSSSSS